MFSWFRNWNFWKKDVAPLPPREFATWTIIWTYFYMFLITGNDDYPNMRQSSPIMVIGFSYHSLPFFCEGIFTGQMWFLFCLKIFHVCLIVKSNFATNFFKWVETTNKDTVDTTLSNPPAGRQRLDVWKATDRQIASENQWLGSMKFLMFTYGRTLFSGGYINVLFRECIHVFFFVALFSPMPLKLPWEPTAVSLSTAISPIFRAQNFHLSWVSNMSSFAWFFVTLLSGDDPISNCFNSVETTFPSWLMKICKSNLLCLNLESSTSMVPSKKYLIWTSSFYVFSFFQS